MSPGLRRGLGHVLALAALVALAFAVHADDVFAARPHFDERIFLRAFDAVERGESPYSQPPFNYPPPFAMLGAHLRSALGERTLLVALRQLEVLAVCGIAWLAVARTVWRGSVRWLVAAAVVAFSFPVENALACGNISPVIALLTLAGLFLAPSRPLLAGVLLGGGVALKPIATAAIPLLAAHGVRARDAWWRTALVAAATAAVLCLVSGARYLPSVWRQAAIPAPPEQDLSIAHALRAFGLHPDPALLFLGITGLAAALLLARRPGERELHAVVLTTCVVGLPVVWPHTFLVALPVQVMAVDRGVRETRGAVWRGVVLALLLAAILSIAGRSGSNVAPPSWPEALRGGLALMPMGGLVILCAFAVARAERFARPPGR